MGLIVSPNDFKNAGRYSMAVDATGNLEKMTSIIAQNEENILIDLLGVQLFDLFKTAYQADPTFALPENERFKNIFNPIRQDFEKKVVRNNGMKEMLMGFLYFHIQCELVIKKTISGAKTNTSEVSTDINPTRADIYGRHNEGVDGARVIQWYICQNKTVYPEYNGQCFRIASPY